MDADYGPGQGSGAGQELAAERGFLGKGEVAYRLSYQGVGTYAHTGSVPCFTDRGW